jgi:hypothetical protein
MQKNPIAFEKERKKKKKRRRRREKLRRKMEGGEGGPKPQWDGGADCQEEGGYLTVRGGVTTVFYSTYQSYRGRAQFRLFRAIGTPKT